MLHYRYIVPPRRILAPRPIKVVKPIRAIDPFTSGLVQGSEVAGKGIILFVLFYCSMNWWHYREMRKKIEEKDKKK